MKKLNVALLSLAASLVSVAARAAVVHVGPAGETSLHASGDSIVSCATIHCSIDTRVSGTWSRVEVSFADGALPTRSAAYDGDLIAVGTGTDKVPGAVDLYRRGSGGWTKEATLTPVDSVPGDNFGADVAIANGRVFVGAPSNTVPATPGAVYVFGRAIDGWHETVKLTQSDPRPDDNFGYRVRASGDLLVATSYTVTETFAAGIVWTSAGTIPGAGASLSLAGGVLALIDADTLYVYRRGSSGWTRELERKTSRPSGNGPPCEVSILGDRIAVGCIARDTYASNGRVELLGYSGGEWKRRALVEPETLDPMKAPPGLGTFVAVGPNYVAASAQMGHEDGVADQLYVIAEPETPAAEGVACKSGIDCASGYCIDGVCCGTQCSGACESCRAASTGNKDGVCATVSRDQPSRVGSCSPYVCRDTGCSKSCVTNEECHSGFLCLNAQCVKASTCRDDRTLVSPDGRESNCAPYRCQETGCPRACAVTTDCLDGSVCDVASKQCIGAPGGDEDSGGCAVRAPHGASALALLGLCVALARLRARRSSASASSRARRCPTSNTD